MQSECEALVQKKLCMHRKKAMCPKRSSCGKAQVLLLDDNLVLGYSHDKKDSANLCAISEVQNPDERKRCSHSIPCGLGYIWNIVSILLCPE